MRYFMDTEFLEDGPHNPLLLISLALVAEDGREFYAENAEADLEYAVRANPWLKDNVISHLTGPKLSHAQIGLKALQFVGQDKKPEFWGYFADYDWVLFAQLFGRMVDLPSILPQYCLDLKQEMKRLGVQKPVITGCGPEHHALSDARWNKACFEYLQKGTVTGRLSSSEPNPQKKAK